MNVAFGVADITDLKVPPKGFPFHSSVLDVQVNGKQRNVLLVVLPNEGGGGMHSEDRILGKLAKYKLDLLEVYSERKPCPDCRRILPEHVKWTGSVPQGTRRLNRTAREWLQNAIAVARRNPQIPDKTQLAATQASHDAELREFIQHLLEASDKERAPVQNSCLPTRDAAQPTDRAPRAVHLLAASVDYARRGKSPFSAAYTGSAVGSCKRLVIAPYLAGQAGEDYLPGGMHELAARTEGARETAVVTLPIHDGAAPAAADGLGARVGDMVEAAHRDVDRAARSLLADVRTILAQNPDARVTLLVRGAAGPVVGHMMKLARAQDPNRGLPVDVVVTDSRLGASAISEVSFTGPVVAVAPAEGGPAAVPALGESPASTQFNDTGQVVVANRGRPVGEKQSAAMVAEVAATEGADEVAKAAGATGTGGGKARAKATPAAAFAPPQGVSSGTVAAAQTPRAGNLGGIDFSSLELRYIADPSTRGTRASAFAFKAVPGKSGPRRASIARRAVRESSDAFFVWLALPPQSFTVNLNPSEPDRIVDSQLGRTDPGRILLEADLRMKKTVARLIHPHSRLGARFWAALDRLYEPQSAQVCLSFRQWIVPAPATVSENRGELYILKAPLDVKMESDYRRRRPVAGAGARPCPGQPQALEERSEALYRRMILPHVQRAVGRRPEYAALRRVYLARVAAEWYRRLGAREGGAFVEIIDSDDISRWVSKRRWRPRALFDQYVRSFRRGEFRVKRRTQEGNVVKTRTLVYGGVDFTSVPQQAVSAEGLRRLRPGLPAMLARSLSRPVVDRGRGEIWLAGASFDRRFAVGDPVSTGGSSVGAPLIIGGTLVLLAITAVIGLYLRRMRT